MRYRPRSLAVGTGLSLLGILVAGCALAVPGNFGRQPRAGCL
jgi:hypothetical protein